ncbi:Glycoside hydrolase family 19 protein (plasmid) [Rhodovastum atsumiense]|uniref:Glycoside hydrolase family 19 protein n=1 Tax=Rhodovastum atsumiense TaxID=504468 RepID=A0A5M6ITA4_9PROT|nr:glycoside hydrolase family 19 protein [Rhodovastum atsumiense]KAA5611544.1 glycoside hydrolase family 19 protein [Rhodovastum atsumiense]CAH2606230.1 Glycoside hydrolase family 19 protein [Rhodovastum atsumiense]
MNWLARLLGQGDERREDAGPAPIAPPQAPTTAPAPASVGTGQAATAQPAFPSPRELAAVLRGMNTDRPEAWAAVLAPACQRHGINTPARLAAFLANAAHESGGFRIIRESLNYSCTALVSVFGQGKPPRITKEQADKLGRKPGAKALTLAQQEAIAAVVYGGSWGKVNLGNIPGTSDASDLIGRGLMQLTGRSNYERLSRATGKTVPELRKWLETMEGAAESAAAYWSWAGCNEPADRGNITLCRKLVNGGTIGMAEVQEHHATALALLSSGSALA